MDVPQSTTELLRLKRRLEKAGSITNGTNQNKVKLILEDGTAYPLEGTLQFRDVTVDPTTGSVILRIVFPNPERRSAAGHVRPGGGARKASTNRPSWSRSRPCPAIPRGTRWP